MYGMRWTPYSETTKEVLEEQLGHEWSFDVDTDGVSGQLVTAGFMRRMDKLSKYSASSDFSLHPP